jgi:hypothetical protein
LAISASLIVLERELSRRNRGPGAAPPWNLRSARAFSIRSETQEAAMPFLFWAIAPFELMKAWCEAFEIKRGGQ